MNGSVNVSLPMLGMYSVLAKATSANSHFSIRVKSGQSVRVKSEITFDAKSGDYNGPTTTLASGVKEYTFTDDGTYTNYFYVSCPNNGKENMYYVSKSNTSVLSNVSASSKQLNIELNVLSSTLNFNNDLQELRINQINGDISEIGCANLIFLTIDKSEGKFPIELLRNLSIFAIAGNENKAELNISNLSGKYGSKLTSFQLYNATNITGDILEWAKRMQQAGRTSGTLVVQGVGSNATLGSYVWGEKDKIITFSESGCTVTDKN